MDRGELGGNPRQTTGIAFMTSADLNISVYRAS